MKKEKLEKFIFEEKFGNVILTKKQRDTVVKITLGMEGYQAIGSTLEAVKEKIVAGTGWDGKMKFAQMCCRFAFRHGLVRL